MNNIEIAVATKAESMYLVHLLNTGADALSGRLHLSGREVRSAFMPQV